MTAPKLTYEKQYFIRLCLEPVISNAGTDKAALIKAYTSLAVEYDVSETMIRRIARKDPAGLASKAGIVGKPRIRKPAGSRPLTGDVNALKTKVSGHETTRMKGPEPLPLLPQGSRIEPLNLVRFPLHRGNSQVTSHGSVIVTDAHGKAVRILACPIYERPGRASLWRDVDITEIRGASVSGEFKRVSGETVKGSLLFDGVTSPDTGRKFVTRVEFHPNSPLKETVDLRRKLQ